MIDAKTREYVMRREDGGGGGGDSGGDKDDDKDDDDDKGEEEVVVELPNVFEKGVTFDVTLTAFDEACSI